jgi:uncharacterized membrane protein
LILAVPITTLLAVWFVSKNHSWQKFLLFLK